MSFSREITHDSKTVPGLKFTVRRIGFGARTEIDRQTLALRQRLRELEVDYPPQSPREKELSRQLSVASEKAEAISEAVAAGTATEADFESALKDDVEPLAAQLADASSVADRRRRKVLDEEYGLIQQQIHCVWIRYGLISIEQPGGEYGGITADELLESGFPALSREIFERMAEDGRISPKDAQNLKLPGTSGAAVPSGTNSTIAPAAEPLDGMRSETASVTSSAK
jgi:hypothetical protein